MFSYLNKNRKFNMQRTFYFKISFFVSIFFIAINLIGDVLVF